jgi:copper ion binding protein
MAGLFSKEKGEALALTVEGMSCMHCVGKVEKGLAALEGVLSAEVNLEQKKAVIRFDPDKVGEDQIRKAISDIGYQVA